MRAALYGVRVSQSRPVFRKITDPIHGEIPLTKLEADVMMSPVMQRLHNVKQLGLAHLVYPGANYSRFSHSVGACFTAARLLTAVAENSGRDIDDHEAQELRLMALLHDVGHYPLSHATERAVMSRYAANPLDGSGMGEGTSMRWSPRNDHTPRAFSHEALSRFIIQSDPDLGRILKDAGFDPSALAQRFEQSAPDKLMGLISSDLDCDRLDYLKRTAHMSGAPYGSIDIGFLVGQATADADGFFCFLPQAARAAEHLLLSRYFDYLQIPFNKTVAALEWSLGYCLDRLIRNSLLDCSGAAVARMVHNGSWYNFDDQRILELFKQLSDTAAVNDDRVLRDHLRALRNRPARLIAVWDEVRPGQQEPFAGTHVDWARCLLLEMGERFSLDPDRLHLWTTSVGFSKAEAIDDRGRQRSAGAVHILNPSTLKAEPLTLRSDALMRYLSPMEMTGLRLYYLPEKDEEDSSLIKALTAYANSRYQASNLTEPV